MHRVLQRDKNKATNLNGSVFARTKRSSCDTANG